MDRIAYIITGLGRGWLAGVSMLLVAYFAYHAFNGENSIHALRDLQAQERVLLAMAEEARAERDYMERQTFALKRSAIDPDMLEEQVRSRLGFTHPDEVIILTE